MECEIATVVLSVCQLGKWLCLSMFTFEAGTRFVLDVTVYAKTLIDELNRFGGHFRVNATSTAGSDKLCERPGNMEEGTHAWQNTVIRGSSESQRLN